MPNETRVKPPSASARMVAASTVSGFASVVISAPSSTPQSSRMAFRIAIRSSAGRIVGVPPPKNTVEAGGSAMP